MRDRGGAARAERVQLRGAVPQPPGARHAVAIVAVVIAATVFDENRLLGLAAGRAAGWRRARRDRHRGVSRSSIVAAETVNGREQALARMGAAALQGGVITPSGPERVKWLMSKQSQSPPRGDKPTPTAPPPPPGWRHWLWPIALFAAFILFLLLPRLGGVRQSTSAYSHVHQRRQGAQGQDVHAGQQHRIHRPCHGNPEGRKDYTTVIPLPFAGTPLETTLQKAAWRSTRPPPAAGSGTQLLYWIILLPPFIVVFWLVRRMSRAGGRGRPAGRPHGRRPGPGQGLRRGAAADQVRRRGRLRRREARDQRGRRLPQAPRAVPAGRRGRPRAAC